MRRLSRWGALLALCLVAGCPDDEQPNGDVMSLADATGDAATVPDGAQDAQLSPDAPTTADTLGDTLDGASDSHAAADTAGDTPDGAPDVQGTVDADVEAAPDVTVDAQPDTTDGGTPGSTCCTTAEDCAPAERCVTGAVGPGFCLPKKAPSSGCYAGDDCLSYPNLCVNAVLPACAPSVEPATGSCEIWDPPVDLCCTSDWDCEPGQRCVGDGAGTGICKAAPAWGSCWDGNDCAPTQTCEGAHVCPCDADCDQPDTLGTCSGPDSGCCTGAGACPAGAQCMPYSGVGWSTCVPVPETGRCYTADDCPAGHTCQGAGVCPCNMDCDMGYEGPGVCVPPAGCTPLKTSWVQEICDAASLVLWDGSQCVGTCPGCCGCEPFCDLTFPSMEACEAACGCPLWDGSCDDAMPPAPWWALTASGCEEIATCVCEGCPGTFPTQAACEACL